jgi:hypothetical protein
MMALCLQRAYSDLPILLCPQEKQTDMGTDGLCRPDMEVGSPFHEVVEGECTGMSLRRRGMEVVQLSSMRLAEAGMISVPMTSVVGNCSGPKQRIRFLEGLWVC